VNTLEAEALSSPTSEITAIHAIRFLVIWNLCVW
jgi:hypothetical protein